MSKRYPHQKILTTVFLLASLSTHSMMHSKPVMAQTKSVSQEIIDTIYEDKALSHFKIEVSDSSYALSLRGEVSSMEEKQKILDIAKGIVGNKSIEDQILVTPSKFGQINVSDGNISNHINITLTKEGIRNTDFKVQDGIVTVLGEYKNFKEVDYIFSLIQNIPGVKKINSQATVGSKPYMQEFKEFEK